MLEVEKKAMNTFACVSPKAILSAVILITVGMYYRTHMILTRTLRLPFPSTTHLGSRAGFHFFDSGRLILPV